MLGVAPGPVGAGGGGRGAGGDGGGGSGGRMGPTDIGGDNGGGGGVTGGAGTGGGVGGSACTWTRGGGGLGGLTLPDGPDAQAESVSVVARSSASRRRLVIALAWRAPPVLCRDRWLLRGRRPWRRRRRDLHWPGRRRLDERRRRYRHGSDLAGAGERLPRNGLPWDRLSWHGLSWHGLSRHRHRGPGRPGRHRTRLAGILEQHLDDALGACDHHTIVGDLLDLAPAHRVTDRVAADALDRGIFQERAALAALDHDAVENG